MNKYEFTFNCSWVFDEPVKHHHFLLRCMPGTYPFQRIYAHNLTLSPYAAVSTSTDSYGNQIVSGTIDKNHTSFSFSSSGFVLCSKYMIHDELDRIFLYPSRFTQPSENMKRFLDGYQLPEDSLKRAELIMELVHRHMTYTPGGTSVDNMAATAFDTGLGVSRDIVHVFITLCRLAGLPARYVIGLAKGVTRSHVWGEVYIGTVWLAFDPTMNCLVEEGYLKIAHGRDYSDCAVDRYYYESQSGGNVGQSKTITAVVEDHIILTRDTVPHA